MTYRPTNQPKSMTMMTHVLTSAATGLFYLGLSTYLRTLECETGAAAACPPKPEDQILNAMLVAAFTGVAALIAASLFSVEEQGGIKKEEHEKMMEEMKAEHEDKVKGLNQGLKKKEDELSKSYQKKEKTLEDKLRQAE